MFHKAVKSKSKLRLALIGPSGSGKTYTALSVAKGLGKKVAVIDTEHGSASKYADLFGFDVVELESFSPASYVQAIHAAEEAGYDIVVIDSLSHAWTGKDGALEMVDKAAARSRTGSSFGAWREVTPEHNRMIDAIVRSKCHVVATMRSKTDYVQEVDERTGKTKIRKVGLAPVQRDGMEYEFDLVGDIDHEHRLVVTKSRCPKLSDAVLMKPGADMAKTLREWLESGVDAVEKPTLASDAEIKEVVNAATALGLGKDYFNSLKERFNVSSSKELTVDAVKLILGELSKKGGA